MNVSDTEVVRSLLHESGYVFSSSASTADIVLVNTCAIRDKAEEKVWQWLRMRRADGQKANVSRQVFGLLGCMAERLKTDILERSKLVDIVCGPDAYRDLPRIIAAVARGEPGAAGYNVQLSLEETYADVAPMRESKDKQSAFVSIMRGCENYCSFCVVPYTRGRERSRPLSSIVDEVRRLSDEGVREVTLLGQNVNSWHIPAEAGAAGEPVLLAKGFSSATTSVQASARFPDLLAAVADVDRDMRVRFTSPHPKHFPDDVLTLMRDTPNICSYVHMPAQSGSNAVLERMRRRYSRESYLELVGRIRETIPGVTLSTDMISGFCGETEEDHADTLRLLREVEYDQGFFFHYSKRDKTEAARRMEDDVSEDVKLRRLREVIDTFHGLAKAKNERTELGAYHLVLVEEGFRRPPAGWDQDVRARTGRTDGNKRVVFADVPIHSDLSSPGGPPVFARPGDYVLVRVTSATSLTLFCSPLARTTIAEYSSSSSAFDGIADRVSTAGF